MIFAVFILRGEIMIHYVSLFPVRLFCIFKMFLLPRDTLTFEYLSPLLISHKILGDKIR